jgi:hypothetical protein
MRELRSHFKRFALVSDLLIEVVVIASNSLDVTFASAEFGFDVPRFGLQLSISHLCHFSIWL